MKKKSLDMSTRSLLKLGQAAILALLCLGDLKLEAFRGGGWLFQDDKNILLVQPRILAHVNGKAITVGDLMRKMDLIFYERYPEYREELVPRYQFYQMSWRQLLEELIDQELMLADAKELKIELSRGDIRKEMERLFGPNVVSNLQKAGLQYDEAVELVRAEMMIQRIMYFKVHTPAMRYATPREVQIAYEEYQKTHQLPAELTYRIISVRSQDAKKAQEVAEKMHARLAAGESIDEVVAQMKEEEAVQVGCTDEEKRTEADISEHYRVALLKLEPGTYSQPLTQESRKRGESLFRLFYLKDLRPAGAPPIADVEDELKGELLAQATQKLTREYLTTLRTRYRVEEVQEYKKIPEEFQPFRMQ